MERPAGGQNRRPSQQPPDQIHRRRHHHRRHRGSRRQVPVAPAYAANDNLATEGTIPMTTPNPSHEERITILETRLDTILRTLATKEDIAPLGKQDWHAVPEQGIQDDGYGHPPGAQARRYGQSSDYPADHSQCYHRRHRGGRRQVPLGLNPQAPAPTYRPRSRGSSTSRSASPSRLNPITTKNSARPGNIASHGPAFT